MKRTLFIALSFLSISVFAQKSDTLITYNFGNYETKAIATESYKVYKKDNVYIRTTFDNRKAITKIETFADKKLKVLNGEYLEYKDGQVVLKGLYLENKRSGLWTNFGINGKPKEAMVYQDNKLNGTYTSYWKNGAVKVSGNYVDGKKVGEWKILYETGSLALKESYDSKNKLTDSTYLDLEGKTVQKADITTEPSFPGGMKQFYMYLAKNIRYPVEAHQSRSEGKVYLSFMVSRSGKIEDVKIISSPALSLSEEAIRVTKLSPDWISATLFGNPVEMPYNIDINFTLR